MNAKLNDGSSPQLETSALQRLVGFTERALFRNRVVVLLFFLVLSLLLGYQALTLGYQSRSRIFCLITQSHCTFGFIHVRNPPQEESAVSKPVSPNPARTGSALFREPATKRPDLQ